MSPLAAPVLVAAALLVLAGAQKVFDPDQASGALRSLGLPSDSRLVRSGAAVEGMVGLVAVTVGGAVPWALVAASYITFTAFVVAAMRAGTMVGSCGCFGREETPPSWIHVVLNLALASAAMAAAVRAEIPLDELGKASALHVVVLVGVTAVAVALAYGAYVDLPRARAAAAASRAAGSPLNAATR